MVISNGTLCVDSFLLLAGALLAYNFLGDRQKGFTFNLCTFYIRRYIRIAPTVLAISLIVSILISSAGEGPLVKANAGIEQEACDNWWWPLLFISNYIPINFTCVDVKWYLSLDMQLVWVSPLILFPLWRRPRVGKAIICALFAIGIAILFGVSFVNKVSLSKFTTHKHQRVNQDGLIYVHTHMRFTPWLIGLLLGHFLHQARKSPPRFSNTLSRVLAASAWIASIALMLTSLLLAHTFFQGDAPYDRLGTSLFVALMRPAWALGLAILVYVCVTGYGGFVNNFLSWSGFVAPSRLSFAVYLCHWTVVSGYHATRKHTRHYDDTTMLIEFIGLAVLSFGAALFVHLFFEAPATALGKSVLGRYNTGRAAHGQGMQNENPKIESVTFVESQVEKRRCLLRMIENIGTLNEKTT